MAASQTVEVFANNATTTVTSGGTTAPATGTVETWTVASSASFPGASSTSTPITQFHVADPALPTEKIAVTNVSGSTWTVTRGAESTTPVAHSPGFTVDQTVTASVLSVYQAMPESLFALTVPSGTALGGTAGTITTATITAAQNAGCQGIYLDPRYVWNAAGLVIKDIGNFMFFSAMTGSIGWGGNISYNTGGYISTGTSAQADGIQVYSDGTSECQGISFPGCVIVGANSNGVVHLGGRQRRISFPNCFIYNTNNTQTTVAAGSNGVAVSTFTGTGTLNVASTTGFASSGNLVVATSTVMATISYTGTTSTSFTGCTTLGGAGNLATGGAAGQAAFGLVVDTALSNNNSENSDFGPHLSVAGANCAVGLGINDQSQHANDSLWDGTTTAAGLVSVVAMDASNHTFLNFYDRSSPTLCTVANHAGTLTFQEGESQNGSTSAPHDLVQGTTLYISRTLTQVTATTTMVIAGGKVVARGRTRWAGTIALSSSAGLDLSDPAGIYSTVTVTGGAGNLLLLSGQYLGGAVGPTVTGYTGTTHTSSWV